MYVQSTRSLFTVLVLRCQDAALPSPSVPEPCCPFFPWVMILAFRAAAGTRYGAEARVRGTGGTGTLPSVTGERKLNTILIFRLSFHPWWTRTSSLAQRKPLILEINPGGGRKRTDRKHCKHRVNDASAQLKPKRVFSSTQTSPENAGIPPPKRGHRAAGKRTAPREPPSAGSSVQTRRHFLRYRAISDSLTPLLVPFSSSLVFLW